MFRQKKSILLVFTLIWLFLSQPFLAQAYIGVAPANPDPNVKFSDSWFVYTLKMGQSKEDAIIINNHSEEIATVRVFPVEAALNSQGTFYTDAEKKVDRGVSQWVKVSQPEIRMGPGESQTVEFTLRVPDKIESKQYLGAVMAEQIRAVKPGEESQEENIVGQSVTIRSLVGVRMYLTVEGSPRKISSGLVILIIISLVILLGIFIHFFYFEPKKKKNIFQRVFNHIFKR